MDSPSKPCQPHPSSVVGNDRSCLLRTQQWLMVRSVRLRCLCHGTAENPAWFWGLGEGPSTIPSHYSVCVIAFTWTEPLVHVTLPKASLGTPWSPACSQCHRGVRHTPGLPHLFAWW